MISDQQGSPHLFPEAVSAAKVADGQCSQKHRHCQSHQTKRPHHIYIEINLTPGLLKHS